MADLQPVVIVRMLENGDTAYHINGDVKLLIIDENCPNDRVYHYIDQTPWHEMEKIIGGTEIGSQNDKRHAGVVARLNEYFTGKPRLQLVSDKPKDDQ